MARKKEKEELENKNQEETNVEITEEPSVSEEPIENIVEDIETMDELEIPIKKENIELISTDNKSINNKVKDEPMSIPDKFVKQPPKKPNEETKIRMCKGRVYKPLGNGYGMFSDDGSVFKM